VTASPALVITPRDNVATALEPLDAGRVLDIAGERITIVEATPRGHKIALRLIRAGEAVLKYGSPIGTATVDIPVGAHVHTHNVASRRGRGDLQTEASAEAPRIAEPPDRSPVTGQRTQ
jgi:altronate hydrolase